ncbi:MAG: hypothetical protein BMS9Abin05_2309 [Rhodothermia bacterium]|nr:MAG: hypothetical protein BMS9Abin05_2309 [Rhodothermia bacterium]
MKTLTTIISIVASAMVSLSLGQTSMTDAIRFDLEKGSKISIEGMSTIGRFKCESSFVQGYGIFFDDQNLYTSPVIEARIAAQVKLFFCNLTAMNADMWDALKSDQFPLIEYVIDDVSIDSVPSVARGTYTVHSSGQMFIAGVGRTIQIELSGYQIGPERFKLEGKTEMSMSDFDVEPPTALFGLVKTHDRISVHFNLITTSRPLPKSIAELF